MKLLLSLLAPYFAVIAFWVVWPNAWLAILAYHAQILFWNWPVLRKMRKPQGRRIWMLAIPSVLAGPLLYVLLPYIIRTHLSSWMDTYHLSGLALVFMVPYFGLVHPFMEQIHWQQLREHTAWSHPLFAGYHMIVLASLITVPWLLLCFAVLMVTSLAWKQMARTTRSLTVPTISHVLADLGVILAAWART
jgi:hypothetical protein